MKYMLMRCIPMKYITMPMRHTLMTCTSLRHAHEIHACEMHAWEMHAYEINA